MTTGIVTPTGTEIETVNVTPEGTTNDVIENAMAVVVETTTTAVEDTPTVMTTTTVAAETTETDIHEKNELTDAAEDEDEKVKKGGLLLRRIQFPSHNENAKPLAGMSMPLDMNSIRQCKPNRLVCNSFKHCVPFLTLLPGLFNLPGANRTQIPPILSIPGLPPPMPVQSFGMGIGGNPNLSRQSRRLYIGSITQEVNEQNLADFFNAKMAEMNIGSSPSGNTVLAVQCNYEKNYAFVEVRNSILTE